MVQTTTNLPERVEDDAAAVRHWLARIGARYDAAGRRRLEAACELLLDCHGDAVLETGESAVRHRLAAADILFGLRMDADTLCAALLQGCPDHRDPGAAALAETFGPGVARMTADLARIEQLTRVEYVAEGGKRAARNRLAREENLRRMLLGVAEDVRVVLLVLADRLHLLRRTKHLDAERRLEIADDTRRVYAPLANRLGVWQLKWELEDLALRAAEPDTYMRIAKALAERRNERQDYIARVLAALRAELAAAGIRAEVTGRPKHIYSIWRKMQRKGVDIDQIFDLRAVRILVDDVPACYSALGVVHGLWPHIPSEFDDYIATPKGNNYQSLHTAVVGPEDKPLEVQIRTHAMHEHAEYGVAAHWAYKEAKGHDPDFQRRVVSMRHWLEQAGDARRDGDAAPLEGDLASAHVYVLTPQAKVVELPRGATPLDFAYAIHSEIGHRCRGARVDGRMVPLTYQLRSGETVEILTQKNAHPSRDWLSPHHGYMVTARARNRVRQWLKQQDFDRHLAEGRAALERELTRLGIEASPQPEKLAERFNLKTGDDLLAAVGRGDLAVGQVARQVGEPRAERREPPDALPPPRAPAPPREAAGRSDVVVEGVGDLMTHMAACCRPVPYDKLVGYVSVGRGVIVHRRSCREILKLSAEERARLVDVTWADQPAESAHAVGVELTAADRRGLLRDISSALADADANVLDSDTRTDATTDIAHMHFTVAVIDAAHLERIIARLKQLPDVLDVRRAQ
ncbi:bifunctional (p)ppGpp synthetase/guanosine-3',5'-bis(diphosphate) 3'-pyrophosphohydrolase [uncultured Thiohalocapsa sp.]|uniref:RelA/SpoT family protein n=1 Tax=uncultured Thiohalocapsa sp. TaxID=768990 RepID=UPI0025DDCB79|nr:bifunctional (p)ppGpp synthetase/guanosine-3',5'-bis(diphosphate) 3'-pyrophosphohydrolase [uncultured Thiohalocapsa sp.]